MATVRLVVCDVCKSTTKEAKRWEVKDPEGDKVSLDLCEQDAAPLVKLVAPEEGQERPKRRGRLTISPSPSAATS